MPTVRKVSSVQAAAWEPPAPAPIDDRYTWVDKLALIYLNGSPRPLGEPPRAGDVLRLRGTERVVGIVLGVRVRSDGIWTHVELAYSSRIQWISKRTIAEHLGRLKGLTRVDQPTKQLNGRVHGGTHGWFVRVYNGKSPLVAKTFSDQAAGGRRESLKAALAFHAAHVSADPGMAIRF